MMDLLLLAQMPDPKGAESVGWLMLTIGGIIIMVAAALACAVYIKQLRASKVVQQQIITQPFVIAMEKEFGARAEYERRHAEVENQVKDTRKYAHDEAHEIRNIMQTMKLAGEGRDQLLHALDERTKTHTRVIDGINMKIDRIVERVADKVEALLQKQRGGH